MKKTKWTASPYLVWMVAFIAVPLAIVVYFAFTDKAGHFTLENIMGLGAYTTVFARSIVLAAIATAICLVLAFPVSYLLSRMRPASQRMMQMLIMLPMWMNFLLRTYAWMSLLEHNGIINRFLGLLGVGPFNMINTSGAVVLGMVYNYLPYMVLPLYTIMVKIDNSVIEAAQDLGANVYHVVAKVLVPLSMPGITTGITMVFVPSISTFIISRMLGGADGSMDVVKEFENLTGIRVNYTTYDTNESLYAKLKSGGGNYDVIIPSDYMIGKMAAEGMLEELDPANIPNAALIGEAYRSKPFDPQNKYSVAYTWGLVCIVYNRTMVDEGDLEQGWGILWDEKYAGQVLMFNNSRDAFAIAGKLLGNSINPGSVQEIEQAAEKLKEQKSVVQSYVMDEVFDKMGGGEAALAPYYVGDGVTMMADNPDLAMFIPAEGTNIYIDAMCIPKGSRNKEAAEMFINFMCETQVALANAEYICYSSPQVEVPALLDEETRENEMMYPGADMLSRCETMEVLPDELNSAMDKAWSDVRSYDAAGNGWVMPLMLVAMLALSGVGYWRKAVRRRRSQF